MSCLMSIARLVLINTSTNLSNVFYFTLLINVFLNMFYNFCYTYLINVRNNLSIIFYYARLLTCEQSHLICIVRLV